VLYARPKYKLLRGSHNSHKTPSGAYLEPRTLKQGYGKAFFARLFSARKKAAVSRAFQKRVLFLQLLLASKEVVLNKCWRAARTPTPF